MAMSARTCPMCGRSWTPTRANYRNATCGQSCGNSAGSGNPWTPIHIQMLRACYGAYDKAEPVPVATIAALLGRSEQAVRSQAHELGLTSATRTRGGGPGSRQSLSGRRDDLGGLYVRSRWEANYARYLQWLEDQGQIVGWDYEPRTFDFPVKRGIRSYTPDFRVDAADDTYEWHEVKGYMDDRSRVKLDRFRKYYPDEPPIVLIQGEELAAIARQVERLVPGWERVRVDQLAWTVFLVVFIITGLRLLGLALR